MRTGSRAPGSDEQRCRRRRPDRPGSGNQPARPHWPTVCPAGQLLGYLLQPVPTIPPTVQGFYQLQPVCATSTVLGSQGVLDLVCCICVFVLWGLDLRVSTPRSFPDGGDIGEEGHPLRIEERVSASRRGYEKQGRLKDRPGA